MIYNRYGSTDIEVSAIGFGGMRFNESDGLGSCAELVKAAYEGGINYFDTAPGYGRSEEIFGLAFKEMKKTRSQKPFYVGTKTFGAKPGSVRKDLETSLKRMGLDYVDILYTWCIQTLEAYHQRRDGGAIKEFEKLKNEGLIRYICVSSHMRGPDIEKMLSDYPFDGVLMGYSAANFAYRETGLEAASKLNMGVGIMNPLGGGIIPQHKERFEFVKSRKDETVTEAAIRFLINDRRISTALIGLSSRRQLAEAIRAVDGFKPIDAAGVSRIRDGIRDAFDKLCTSCGYCDECPQEIPIPKFMDAYNLYLLDGDRAEIVKRVKNHWWIKLEDDILGKCTQCGMCETACTQKLDICERLEEIRTEIKRFLAEQARQ
ncbi:MAG: aldo/keto reductase [Planctomycetota bacterium]